MVQKWTNDFDVYIYIYIYIYIYCILYFNACILRKYVEFLMCFENTLNWVVNSIYGQFTENLIIIQCFIYYTHNLLLSS